MPVDVAYRCAQVCTVIFLFIATPELHTRWQSFWPADVRPNQNFFSFIATP